ncbi:MAG: hypothetical protein C4B55_02510 [Candidatus Methanophagaceae archaeon]|nr:MAG: hypothetical protein C4B55_02510 [Methanophagales archaeon]
MKETAGAEETEKKFEEYQKIIKNILSAFHRVPFSIILESTLGYEVYSMDLRDERNLALKKNIVKLADSITLFHNKHLITPILYKEQLGHLPRNFRANEVSVILERVFPQRFEELKEGKGEEKEEFECIAAVEKFGAQGYPDEKIEDKWGRTTYLELKATTRPHEGSPRDFFFTPLKNTRAKIKNDALHLLLGSVIREVEPQQFKTVGWKLEDLSKIKVTMKPEFNTDNKEIYIKEAVIEERWVEEID